MPIPLLVPHPEGQGEALALARKHLVLDLLREEGDETAWPWLNGLVRVGAAVDIVQGQLAALLRLPSKVEQHREDARDVLAAVRVEVAAVVRAGRVRGDHQLLRHAEERQLPQRLHAAAQAGMALGERRQQLLGMERHDVRALEWVAQVIGVRGQHAAPHHVLHIFNRALHHRVAHRAVHNDVARCAQRIQIKRAQRDGLPSAREPGGHDAAIAAAARLLFLRTASRLARHLRAHTELALHLLVEPVEQHAVGGLAHQVSAGWARCNVAAALWRDICLVERSLLLERSAALRRAALLRSHSNQLSRPLSAVGCEREALAEALNLRVELAAALLQSGEALLHGTARVGGQLFRLDVARAAADRGEDFVRCRQQPEPARRQPKTVVHLASSRPSRLSDTPRRRRLRRRGVSPAEHWACDEACRRLSTKRCGASGSLQRFKPLLANVTTSAWASSPPEAAGSIPSASRYAEAAPARSPALNAWLPRAFAASARSNAIAASLEDAALSARGCCSLCRGNTSPLVGDDAALPRISFALVSRGRLARPSFMWGTSSRAALAMDGPSFARRPALCAGSGFHASLYSTSQKRCFAHAGSSTSGMCVCI
eukprot:2103695-Prymnesium_polylepis.2